MSREGNAVPPRPADALLVQGWTMVASFMALGLLLEGLLGFKIPGYVEDETRRELFRLAHTHGTLLGLVLVAASLSGARLGVSLPAPARRCLRTGALMLPVGFFLGGLWHPEGDPGLAIWLVPPGALLALFGVLALALQVRGRGGDGGANAPVSGGRGGRSAPAESRGGASPPR